MNLLVHTDKSLHQAIITTKVLNTLDKHLTFIKTIIDFQCIWLYSVKPVSVDSTARSCFHNANVKIQYLINKKERKKKVVYKYVLSTAKV